MKAEDSHNMTSQTISTSFLDSLAYVRDELDNDLTGGGSGSCCQVELLVRCENLVDLDVFSKTDPMCVVFGRQFGQWREIGRTEAITDTLNPRFTETFMLDYDEDESCIALKFAVYDVDSKSTDLNKHDFVGGVETSLSTLVQHKVTQTLYTLRAPGDPKGRGQIMITAEKVRPTNSKLLLHLMASKLDKTGLVGQSKRSSCIEVCRYMSGNYFHPIHRTEIVYKDQNPRTEIVYKDQNPRWRPFELSLQKLCNGDPDRQIQIVCWHIKHKNEQHFTGATTMTLRDILKHGQGSEVELLKQKKGDSKTQNVKGHLRFLQARVDMAFTLQDYVRGGCSLRFAVAIDFTSSNGDPHDPQSLHYIGPPDNEYVEALQTMGGMLSHYDLEQSFPAFGFGAKKKKNNDKTRHCFSLSGLRNDPFCKGLNGVLESYRKALEKHTLSGPTLLGPVLREAIRVANINPLTQQSQQYWVLLVITDGVVNDADDTLEALVDSCSVPLSIVIVGVGPADFSAMEELLWSTTEHPLMCPHTKRVTSRNNVHFTSIRKDKYIMGSNTLAAREALAAVSSHMVEFFNTQHIPPNRPIIHRTDPMLGTWTGDDVTDSGAQNSATSPFTRTQVIRTKSRRSQSSVGLPAGPRCPTCGSCIEETAGGSTRATNAHLNQHFSLPFILNSQTC